MQKFDVVVIGGGAAGLACAVNLKKINNKISVAIVETGERLGKKISATGNGQGNVTNMNMSVGNYFGGNNKLVESITCSTQAKEVERNLFHLLLIPDEVGRVYPGGKQASSLVDSLMSDVKNFDITTILSTKVTAIKQVAVNNIQLTLSNANSIMCNYAVVAVGGKAQKQFNTDGTSYEMLKKLGHSLTPLYPSLVQLKTDTTYIKTLKGIRVDCLVSAIYNGNVIATKRGDVIFTDYGVSGNAIFSISPYIVDKKNVTLNLQFLPDIGEEIIADIKAKKQLGYPTSELLSGTLHNQLGRAIIKRCNSNDEKLIYKTLKNFTLEVVGNLGFDYAQVTKGGINMNEITDELESKFVKNLFLVGEVLDVDGECGGYNLHWAFTSGTQVAMTISNRIDKIN